MCKNTMCSPKYNISMHLRTHNLYLLSILYIYIDSYLHFTCTSSTKYCTPTITYKIYIHLHTFSISYSLLSYYLDYSQVLFSEHFSFCFRVLVSVLVLGNRHKEPLSYHVDTANNSLCGLWHKIDLSNMKV